MHRLTKAGYFPVLARLGVLIAITVTAIACGGRTESLLRYPVIYADMDGTLLGSDGKVRQETVEAIKRYRSCGGHFGVATGRTLEQVRPFLRELDPDLPLVLLNGAVIASADGVTVTSSEKLPLEVAKAAVVASAGAEGVIGLVAFYPFGAVADRDDESLKAALSSASIEVSETCDLGTCLDSLSAGRGSGPPMKLLLVAVPGSAEAVTRRVAEAVGEGAKVMLSSPAHGAIEITPVSVGKAPAITRVLEEEGFGREQVLVIGDGENDAEMLRAFPAGVAMANCHPATCDAALLVTKNNDSDAIARVIEALAMGPACSDR